MPIATYKLWVDWDNDGLFAGSADDVSSDVMHADASRGFSTPLARLAFMGRMTALLRNDTKTYSPPLTGYILPRRAVKLTMEVDSTSAMLYYGYLDSIVPTPNTLGHRVVTFECSDAMSVLNEAEASIALQINTRGDVIVKALVDAVYTPPAENYDPGVNYFPVSAEKWETTTDVVTKEVGSDLMTE